MFQRTGTTYPDQDPLALQVDISDGQLAGQRHVCVCVWGYQLNKAEIL